VLHFQVSHKSKKEIYLAPIRIFLRTKIDDYWTIVTAICDFRYGKHQGSYVGKMTKVAPTTFHTNIIQENPNANFLRLFM
jgi:hypothetical protein